MNFTLPADFPEFLSGWVWLVGAGPGDPGLLTLHAVHALQQADVIIYDALVDARILSMANPNAVNVFLGKRGGQPSPKQKEISKTLIEYAKQGKRVLRLKGGDPFVFGRGAEEALALVDAHIPFRIVPGITAGIGGAAYAGIPVTHNECNVAVTFITGHSMTGDIPQDLNWQALAKGASVLVFYMAVRQMPQIVHHLLAAGRSEEEAVAFIMSATTKEQKVVTCQLHNAVEMLAHVKSPAIIIVGPVVTLREKLDWLSHMAAM